MSSDNVNNEADIDGLFELTNEDVDDALSGLDFDAMAETMADALPDANLMDDMRSLGTCSPSESESVMSKGSKRSRAEFDTDSECDSSMHGPSKRMEFQTGFPMSRTGSGLGFDELLLQPQVEDDNNSNLGPSPQKGPQGSPTKLIRQDREREGRCPDCGLDTHRIIMNDNGFELQALTIEGEVLNGRCLLCNPLKEGERFSDGMSAPVPNASTKKGGRKNGESSGRKKAGSRNDSETGGGKGKLTRTTSRGNTPGSSTGNMSPPPHQQRQTMPPPSRDSRRASKVTPTPNQYHSKMALMKQAQLPRKHTAMQHAVFAFGNTTNNRAARGNNKGNTSGRNSNVNRRSSTGSVGGTNNQTGNKPVPPPPSSGNNNGTWAQHPERHHSSNASLSSVSCSEVESAHLQNSTSITRDDASQYSQSSGMGGGLGQAMAMGMGMHCAETASTLMSAPPPPPQQPHRSTSAQSQSPHDSQQLQTPQSQQRRMPSDGGPLSRSGSTAAQTPQSVPANMNNMMSSRMAQTPQSMPVNMNNAMSSRMSGGGGSSGVPSSQSMMTNTPDMSSVVGNVPQAVRVAHSKLQSSIYHHHIYPMTDETERALMEKTLVYLESGSGDICDIIVAMRRFPFSLPIQRVACEKLFAHCFDQEHAQAIGLVGGIRTVIDAMEHHPEDVSLQRGCTGVIKHLAGASTYNLDMLDRMGSVAIIVATMERHSNNAPLLESCCWAMESMSRSSSSELKMRVANGGGIHAAMKAVETFPNNESLLRAAFHCLRQLGYNPSQYNSGQLSQLQGNKPGQQQQQQQRQQGSNSQQKQQQQVPSYNRGNTGGGGGGGGGMSRGSGMMMMQNMQNNNSMMGGNPMNPMVGNAMNNNMGNMSNMMGNNMRSNSDSSGNRRM